MNKILAILGTVCLLVGIALVMCLPYAESFTIWNARKGAVVAIPLVIMGMIFWGIAVEKR